MMMILFQVGAKENMRTRNKTAPTWIWVNCARVCPPCQNTPCLESQNEVWELCSSWRWAGLDGANWQGEDVLNIQRAFQKKEKNFPTTNRSIEQADQCALTWRWMLFFHYSGLCFVRSDNWNSLTPADKLFPLQMLFNSKPCWLQIGFVLSINCSQSVLS